MTSQFSLAITTFAALFVFSGAAQACEPGFDSLQFGGFVRNVQKSSGRCTFQIELNSKVAVPKVETNCPLYPGEVGALTFIDESCSLAEGSEISGVMSLNRETGQTSIQ